MQCQLVRSDQLPIGAQALCLFVVEDELHAGIIEHRCDGRFIRSEASQSGTDGIVPTIGLLLKRQPELLYVVLENDAYWPEMFPRIQPLQ